MRSNFWAATLVALMLPAAAGSATSTGPAPGPSLALAIVDVASAAWSAGPAASVPSLALAAPLVAPVRYRPREYRARGSAMPTTSQIHAGFFDPSENFSTGFYGGFRVGPQVDPRLQLGLAVDWWHKGESQTVRIDQGPLPGGGSGERRRELSRSSADLIPILFFAQLSGDENLSIIPYGGAGIGYEVLSLTAEDYATRQIFDAAYGGLGWQVWAGAAMPLSGRTRVTGEVFYNGSEVGRDVDDFEFSYREIVKMNGVGMRFGASWGF